MSTSFAPVSGYSCLLQIAPDVASLSAGTGFALATDFTVTPSQSLIKGTPTFGSSVDGVIDPSYFSNGEETMDLSWKQYFDPTGVSTNLLLNSIFARSAAGKVFGIKITIGTLIITASAIVCGYSINPKPDGSIAMMSISKVALFNTTINTPYELANSPEIGSEND